MFLLLCTEILSRRKPTVVLQNSTYKGNDVSLANDWNLNFKELDCSPNNINQTQTRLQVDLVVTKVNSFELHYVYAR